MISYGAGVSRNANTESLDRLGDVLDLLRTEVVERHLDLPLDLIVDHRRDVHPPNIAEPFEPSGHIHSVARGLDDATIMLGDTGIKHLLPEWGGRGETGGAPFLERA